MSTAKTREPVQESANEYGQSPEAGTVRLERLLPGPIELVWSYLVESDKRATWLASGEIEPRIGGKVELNFLHANLSSEKQVPERYKSLEKGHCVRGQVTKWDPPRLLAHSWGEDSEVTYELAPRGEKALLTITHRRLGDRNMMISAAAGWDAHVGILSDTLEGRAPRGFWSTHERLAADYDKRLPRD